MKQPLILLILALTFAGCSNPVNRHTAIRYEEQAYGQMAAGNWFEARMGFGRAITNAEIGGIDESQRVNLWYEYGRASGVICDWAEAERGLGQALRIMQKHNDGRLHYVLVEIGRMNLDRKNYGAALQYFERAQPVLEKNNIEIYDPLAYADYLDEYALALKEMGRSSDSMARAKRATEIRSAFPGKRSDTQRTPYGTQCANP